MPTDAELLHAYAEKHSETAFAELVERRIGFVHGAALRQVAGNAHMARDVTQAVFSLAARKAATLARHEAVLGWLYTTTTHVARRTWRNAQNRRKSEQEALIVSEIQNSEAFVPEEEFAKLLPLLDEALEALRAGEREAVLLRFFEGRAFADIGAALNMSEDAARMRVARAVVKMRATLARRGVTSTTAALGALMSAEAAAVAPAGLATTVSAGAMASAGIAPTAAAGASALLAFMGSTKITGITVLALLIAGGGIFFTWQRDLAAAEALAEARRENKTLLAKVREAERKANNTAEKPQIAHDPVAAGKRLFAGHPDIKEKFEACCIARGYALTYQMSRELDLPAEKRAALAELHASTSKITRSNVPGYGTVTLPGPSATNAEAVLGAEIMAKVREQAKRMPRGSGLARSLAKALYFTDTPLTTDQSRAYEEAYIVDPEKAL